jgi:hypothetical protein
MPGTADARRRKMSTRPRSGTEERADCRRLVAEWLQQESGLRVRAFSDEAFVADLRDGIALCIVLDNMGWLDDGQAGRVTVSDNRHAMPRNKKRSNLEIVNEGIIDNCDLATPWPSSLEQVQAGNMERILLPSLLELMQICQEAKLQKAKQKRNAKVGQKGTVKKQLTSPQKEQVSPKRQQISPKKQAASPKPKPKQRPKPAPIDLAVVNAGEDGTDDDMEQEESEQSQEEEEEGKVVQETTDRAEDEPSSKENSKATSDQPSNTQEPENETTEASPDVGTGEKNDDTDDYDDDEAITLDLGDFDDDNDFDDDDDFEDEDEMDDFADDVDDMDMDMDDFEDDDDMEMDDFEDDDEF